MEWRGGVWLVQQESVTKAFSLCHFFEDSDCVMFPANGLTKF